MATHSRDSASRTPAVPTLIWRLPDAYLTLTRRLPGGYLTVTCLAQLNDARAAAAREAEAIAARELRYAQSLETAQAQLEREQREKRTLERQLEEAQSVKPPFVEPTQPLPMPSTAHRRGHDTAPRRCATTLRPTLGMPLPCLWLPCLGLTESGGPCCAWQTAAARTAEKAEVAASGDVALRAEVASCLRRAEEAEQLTSRLRSELRLATDEATRHRVRAENAEAEAQRVEIRSRRAAAQVRPR